MTVPPGRTYLDDRLAVGRCPGMSATEDGLIGYRRERPARDKRPESGDVVEALPRNATGRNLAHLRAPYRAGRDRQTA
jgi:fatty-acyl-CoA synthase